MNTDLHGAWPSRVTPFAKPGRAAETGRPQPPSAARPELSLVEQQELRSHSTQKAALASAFDMAAKAVREGELDQAAIHAGYALKLMKEL